MKDPNESLENYLQAVESGTHFQGHDAHLCSGLCEGSCLPGVGGICGALCTSQLLRPLALCLHPSGGCPHPRRPGHLDPTQSPNQSLPMTLRTTDQRALSSPKRPNGHHTVEPNSHPSAHPRAPRRQVAIASSTGSRWSRGLWQSRPWPLSSQNPRPQHRDAGLDPPGLGCGHWRVLTEPGHANVQPGWRTSRMTHCSGHQLAGSSC